MSFKPVESNPNFVAIEEKLLNWWYKSGVVRKYLHKNDTSKSKFSFLDGPITANNPMGVHHAWGRTLKDLYQRYHNMRGERQRFQNGFDCQGLWVEVEVEKELGFKSKKDIEKYGIAKFVEKCKERVRKYAEIQTEQSKRLGYFMDWENSYYTMSDENNYMIWHFLKQCWQNGWLYKGRDSVPWCPRCGTAISQHEMLTEDYKLTKHEAIYFKFKRLNNSNFKSSYFLVWTTTPWTIPANVALVVDPKMEYVEVEQNGEKLILAKERTSVLTGQYKIIHKFQGKSLIGQHYHAPFDELPRVKQHLAGYTHRVVASDPVILPVAKDEGTGIIHAATGAGSEDFTLGKKEKLPVIPIIDESANYLDGMNDFSGKNAKQNPNLIIDFLKKTYNGEFLYKTETYKHRYPACWRCKEELVWRVVDEWYIAMDKKPSKKFKVKSLKTDNKTLRQRMISVAKKIKWLPAFGLARELDWLANMHDWLISKKRYWGLALPIWHCDACGEFKVIGGKKELENETVKGWEKFSGHTPHRPWIDNIKIRCRCGKLASRIKDVGNPWLDAGIIAFSTYIDPHNCKLSYITNKRYWWDWYPADFITESFPGQFKNWFYSLIAMSTVLENTNPFRTVLGFGTVFGEDGRPMHKSWGNAIEFNQAANEIGVDVMRWVYSLADPTNNVLFGYKLASETRRKFHLPLWNSYKFFITYANLNKFKSQKLKSQDNLARSRLLDRWILAKLNQLTGRVTKFLDSYSHERGASQIMNFVEDLSTWYIRRSRERVYPTSADIGDCRECLRTLHAVLVTLSRLLAPFNPFIAEEMYKNLTGEKSVHLASWPEFVKLSKVEKELIKTMLQVRKICELGHAQRKKVGIKVRQPLKKLKVKNEKLKIGNELMELIKDELNIKIVQFIAGKKDIEVELDTKITPALKTEGETRDLIRQIQNERKKQRLSPADKIEVSLPSWPKVFTREIMRKTLAKKIVKADKFQIKIIPS